MAQARLFVLPATRSIHLSANNIKAFLSDSHENVYMNMYDCVMKVACTGLNIQGRTAIMPVAQEKWFRERTSGTARHYHGGQMMDIRIHATVALVLITILSLGPSSSFAAEPAEWQVYIGTYTGGASEGIYLLRLNAVTGALDHLGLAAEVENPSFLAFHPRGPFLYSVGRGTNAVGEHEGLVSAFSIQSEGGRLTFLNQQSTVGDGPCHVVVSRTGRYVLAANYGGGSATVLPLEADGRLGEATCVVQHEGSSVHPQRQQRPHAHAVTLDAAGRFVFVCDLGTDRIMIYRLDEESGNLVPHDPPYAALSPGAGPRHFTFHPSGAFAYVVNELDNTVTAFAYDADAGRLDTIHSIGTLPEDFAEANTTAEIRVHPSGRFVYVSNRGHDSIAAFSVDEKTGQLTSLGQTSTRGKVPRNFNISPDGRFLLAANQQTDNVVVFRIDADTGALEDTGSSVEVPAPVCVLFRAP